MEKDGKFSETYQPEPKWTEETVMAKLNEMSKGLSENKYYTRKEVAYAYDLYPDWFGYMEEKFKENKSVFRAIKKVIDLIEINIVKDTMTGDAKSATFSIFLLKNSFGYEDKKQLDVQEIKPLEFKLITKEDGDKGS